MNADDVRQLLGAKIGEYSTLEQAAWRLGISAVYLEQVMKGRARPGFKVLKILGLKRVFTYEACADPVQIQAKCLPSGSVGKPVRY